MACADREDDSFYCAFSDSAGNAYVACIYGEEYTEGIVGYNWRRATAATGPDLCLERGLVAPVACPAPFGVRAKWLIEASLNDANATVETAVVCESGGERALRSLVVAV